MPKDRKKSPIESFALDQNMTINEIREKFPAIYAELANKKMSLKIDEVEDDKMPSMHQKEKQNQDPFSNYEPNIYDFLARARTNEEGKEIIDFLAKQGQISPETAINLTKRLQTLGIRSFGPIRSSDYYYRKSSEIITRKLIQKRYPSQVDSENKD
ncbi:MAG: DUF2095 family protein [Promethearchaeota archaeon]